jgi:hypothetical protein
MDKPPRSTDLLSSWRWLVLLSLLTLTFFWLPLFDPDTSPQWDAVDVHYSSQKYFADQLLRGHLPFWTPYIFSGFPFLADPQVGAWYPLNWPFFLLGITPKAIQAELVLHTLLAASGMFLLLLQLANSRWASIAGAFFFAYSGYFTDHSQHVGLYCAACWLPWLALFLVLAADRSPLRWTGAAGLAAGAMILAGGFQAALYGYLAIALFAAAWALLHRSAIPRILLCLGGMVVLGVLLSAVMSLPGLELTANSSRAGANYASTTDRLLHLKALPNLWWPDATGTLSATSAPDTAYYLFSGVLLLPLALLGLRDPRSRVTGLFIILPAFWYMLGPAFGFYRIGEIIPLLHQVRAPIHGWFAVVFGLSILAAAGAGRLVAWLPAPPPKSQWIAAFLAGVIFFDLYYWNSLVHPSAYARASWDSTYGALTENTRLKIQSTQPPSTRLDAPDKIAALGPLNHPLDLNLETTYGYNPLALTRYEEYRAAAAQNPKLLPAMNVSRRLDLRLGGIVPVDNPLPRAYFSRSVVAVPDDALARQQLATLDPETATIVNSASPAPVDPTAAVLAITPGEQQIAVRYRAAAPALIRIAIPYFPGWTASVDGVVQPLHRADHAFLGVIVPAGEKELLVQFHSTRFALGLTLSSLAFVACLLLVFYRRRAAVS